MTNELKPCPFCGSEAHIYRHPTTGDYAPVCNNDRCEVYWQREYGTEEQAIAAWNRRACDELEKCKKLVYEMSADVFNIQTKTPTPPQYFGIENESAIIAEEKHELRITYPQVFINGRPVSWPKRMRVTIELLDGDSE